MPFSLVLLNQNEQVIFYIASAGFYYLYTKRSKMSDKQHRVNSFL